MHATPYFKHANIVGYIKYIGPPPLFLKPGSAPAYDGQPWMSLYDVL